MASSNIQIECAICTEAFNSSTRRPRGLPCLHHFCTSCLQSCIAEGIKTCSVCRQAFTVSKAEDIPINNMLENMIEMVAQMASTSASANDSRTEEVIMREKENTLKDANHCAAQLTSATTKLENIVAGKNVIITSLQDQINLHLRVCDDVQKQLMTNKDTLKQLQGQIRSLDAATTQNNVNKACEEIHEKVKSVKNLLVEQDEKYNNEEKSQILLTDPRTIANLIERRNVDVYAIDSDRTRSSKLLNVNGTLELYSMVEDVKPTPDALLIPIVSLLTAVGNQPVVYLDLAAKGQPLGRLRIRLSGGARRMDQMLHLCTGLGGNTLKGRSFSCSGDVGEPGERIDCYDYLTANGSLSHAFTVADPVEQDDKCKRYVAGAVTGFPDDTDFRICTITDDSDTDMCPELGSVLSGLDMLRQAIRQYDAKDITIVQSGVEI